MAKAVEPIQSNYTGGELDPQLVAREEAEVYYRGAERARNVMLIPHGGFTRRPALLFRDEKLPVIEEIDLSGATVTAPEGGTAANATDGDPATRLITTTALGVVDPYVVLHVDMGAGFTDLVRFADVENLSTGAELLTSALISFTAPSTITATGLLSGFTAGRKLDVTGSLDKLNDAVFTMATTSANTITVDEATVVTQGAGETVTLEERPDFLTFDEFRVQRSVDDAVWVDVGSNYPFVTGEDGRWYYRRAPAVPTSYRYWRVVRLGATDGQDRVVELGEFKLWKDTGVLSKDRQIEFEASALQTYTVLLTAFNGRIYKDGVRQADVQIPHSSAQLAEINWTQSLDTLLIFHEDVQTHAVRRLGDDTLWLGRPQAFSSIPTRTFGDVQAAGAEDEDVWSATRGWPRCGTFFKKRLYAGGTRDLSGTYWASSIADVFGFLPPASPLADDAFEVTISSDAAVAIYHMESADFLFIISSSGPFFQLPRDEPATQDTVDAGRVRGKKRAKGPGFRALQLDKGVVYLDDSGEQVNEIIEEVFRGSFEVNNLAFLAPHLIRNPVDMVLRRSLSTDRGDLLLLVNAEGSLAVLQTLRDRDFSGWTGWHVGKAAADTLQAKVVSVGTQIGGINGRYFAVVERFIDGQLRHYYEEFLDTALLDSSVVVTATAETVAATAAAQADFVYSFTSPAADSDLSVRLNLVLLDLTDDYTVDLGTKTVTLSAALAAAIVAGENADQVRIALTIQTVAVAHLEGELVEVRADGAVGTPQTVSGGVITLVEHADAEVQVGLGFPDVKEILVNELQTRTVDPLTEEEARFEVFKDSNGAGAGDGVLVRDMPAAVPPDAGPTLRGKMKRVHTAILTVSNTQGFYFGANDQPTEPVIFTELGDNLLDRRPPIRSGQFRVHNLQGWTLDGQSEIAQRDAIPLTVLSGVRRMVIAS